MMSLKLAVIMVNIEKYFKNVFYFHLHFHIKGIITKRNSLKWMSGAYLKELFLAIIMLHIKPRALVSF